MTWFAVCIQTYLTPFNWYTVSHNTESLVYLTISTNGHLGFCTIKKDGAVSNLVYVLLSGTFSLGG